MTESRKTVWLIGASEGIGEALARKLAGEGAQVIVSARSKDKLQALVASLPGSGHSAVPLDVTQLESVKKAWQELSANYPVVDTVIYNAGAYEPMNAKAFDLPKIEKVVDVNFHGALRVLASVLPVFVARKSGHIVLVASVAGYGGLPNAVGYGASKAALLHLAENLRLDLADCNIKVQVVSPGFVKTRLTDKNSFKMPFIISADEAAAHIADGMRKGGFEIHFPKCFTYGIKLLNLLPYPLYLYLAGKFRE